MTNTNQRQMLAYSVVAALVLLVGVLLSVSNEQGYTGTWWLLALTALVWVQSSLLRREIPTSGQMLRLFTFVAWSLLGFALVSLLPPVDARIVGDMVVLLLIAAAFFGPVPAVRASRAEAFTTQVL